MSLRRLTTVVKQNFSDHESRFSEKLFKCIRASRSCVELKLYKSFMQEFLDEGSWIPVAD